MSQVQNSSQKDLETLNRLSDFKFSCNGNLPCFTQCCRDVNIYLTPYDVLRMRRALKMGSEQFLSTYTRHFLAKVTHIPVVQLAMDHITMYCKLVTDQGCSIYEDRPWACRMYPLDLADAEDRYRLIVDSKRCLGLLEQKTWKVHEWLDNQGVVPFEHMERVYHQIMPPAFKPGQKMDAGLGKLIFMAYDLDRFAKLLENKHFRSLYELNDEQVQQLHADDEALLMLAFRYIRVQLEELIGV